jgi:hypothetical protein
MAEPEDPPRLFEPHSDAPAELRSLFEFARDDLPSDARLAAIQASLPRATMEPTAAPPSTNPALGKALLAAIGVGLVGAGVWFVSRSEQAAPPVAPVSAPPPSVSVAPPATPAVSPEPPLPEPVPAASSAAVIAPKAPAPPRAGNEAALLERARRALASEPKLALSLARRHEKEFPNGTLRQEREVIAIEALRRLGRSNEATDRAEDFRNEFPNSAHGRSVERGRSK